MYISLFFAEEHKLSFICINSKPHKEIRKGKTGGLGLKNIQRRLELLFPGRYRLEITDEKKNIYGKFTNRIMNCIIVDDEPLAREAIELLIKETTQLNLVATFNNAVSAAEYIKTNPVELIFLDIQMPEVTGLEFAREVPKETLIIFTTAYTEYAIDSYEIDAVDYLVKPVELPRFRKAVEKAIAYYILLIGEKKENIEVMQDDFMFIKSERRYFKVEYKDILFVEGLKDYSIIQTKTNRIITRVNLKNLLEHLPRELFLRTTKSYIVNVNHIESFDNNDIYIGPYELAIGSSYKETFFEKYVMKGKKLR